MNAAANQDLDYYLGRQQNAIANTGVDRQPANVKRRSEETEKKGGFPGRVKKLYYKDT